MVKAPGLLTRFYRFGTSCVVREGGPKPDASAGYKNFDNKFWRLENINIGQNLMIQYNLESGERDLSHGDIGFRVYDLEIGFVKSVGLYSCLSTWGNSRKIVN